MILKVFLDENAMSLSQENSQYGISGVAGQFLKLIYI